MNISLWKQKTLAHYTSTSPKTPSYAGPSNVAMTTTEVLTHTHTHTHTQADRQTGVQATDVSRTPACMGEVSTVSKRGGCGAKYRNRIMSFLSMLHRFHISPASLVAPSPCHSSSLSPPLFPLNGPNISLEPLSCIKEIYYTRNFRLCDGSKIFFSHPTNNKKHLYRFWQQDIGRFPHLERRILQPVRSCPRTDPDYISTPVKNANYFSLCAFWIDF